VKTSHSLPVVDLKPGREKSLLRRHPWVFSGAVARVRGEPQPGQTVRVHSAGGRFLAHAAWSAQSQICARVWNYDESEAIDRAFFDRRLREAIAARDASMGPVATGDARRLINAEGDGLPGIVIDRYDDTVVMQLLSAGAEAWRSEIGELLAALPGIVRVYERSDADVRELEGLPPRSGAVQGEAPDAPVAVHEWVGAHRVELLADVRGGHKTGFYLDQSVNRALVGSLAAGRDVLNCFAFSGAFAFSCVAGGARHVTSIESAADALVLAREMARLNRVPEAVVDWIEGDVFAHLRRFRDAARRFDLIILDPPKFAPTQAHAERAARAYKDINLLAFKLLAPDGLLATFSCSGAIDAGLFRQIVAGAAEDAGVDVRVRAALTAAPDHPVRLAFPEGDYLKGLLLQRLP
jgi:23S rRNA (cytosine1962-C5)-methyltransferase